ncbi:MAG: CRISPR-associated CARF protein Csa3 [Nitrososphaerota archaeon]
MLIKIYLRGPMLKCLIATFGWTEQFVLSSILKYGISPHDEIVLLVPDRKDERTEIILRDFESFLKRYGEGVKLHVKKISLESFERAVKEVSEVILEILSVNPEQIIVNLSGGMRALILATYTALQLISPKNLTIELETEDRSKCYMLPSLSLRTLIRLGRIDERILKLLSIRSMSTTDLLKELKIPRSTMHKHLKELNSLGLILLERKGKMLYASLTQLGNFLSIILTHGK